MAGNTSGNGMTFVANSSVHGSLRGPWSPQDTKSLGLASIPLVITGCISSVCCMYSSFRHSHVNRSQKCLPSAMSVLTFSLSLASFLFSALVLPVATYTMVVTDHNPLGSVTFRSFCRFQAFTYFTLIGVCAFSHAAIAINRFLTILFSSQYPSVRSSKVTFTLLALSWLLPASVFVIPLITPNYGQYGFSETSNRCAFMKLDPTYQIAYKIFYSLVPFVITLLAYTVIVAYLVISQQRLKQHAAERHLLDGEQLRRQRNNTIVRKDLKVTRTAFILCVCFLVCFIPNSVFGVAVSSLKGLQSMVGGGFNYWVWIGCTINPLVYLFLHSGLRQRLCGKRKSARPPQAHMMNSVVPTPQSRP